MSESLRYSLVMPAYNEGANIHDNLVATAEVLRPLGGFEIIAVNDGSADNSASEIRRATAAVPELRLLDLPHAGKGEAIRRGAAEARGEYVILYDADLDLPPEQLLFFVAMQRARQADAVIGSKLHPDSTVHYPLRRRIYSLGYYCLVKLLFGLKVRDTQTGLKLIRRTCLADALEGTRVRGYTLDLELLVRLTRAGARIVEAPVVVDYRMPFGRIGAATAWQILRETLQIWREM